MRKGIKAILALGSICLSIGALSSCTSDDIADLRSQISQLQSELDALKSEMSSLQKKMDSDVKEVKDDYGMKIADLQEQITNNQTKINELSTELASAKAELNQKLQTEISNLKDYVDGEISTLKERIASDEGELEALKTKHQEDIASLQEDYNAKITSLTGDAEEQRKALEDDYNSKLESLNSTYDAKCKLLEDDIASCNQSIAKLKEQFENDKKSFEEVYNAKLEALQTSYDAKIAQIESDIASSSLEIASLKEEMNKLIEDIQSDYNKKIDELSKRVSKFEGTEKHYVYFYLDGSCVQTLEVNDGSKISAPLSSLTKGYYVSSWYNYDSGMRTPWNFSGCMVTSDLYLYAEYTYESYSVRFKDTKFNLQDAWRDVQYKGYYNFSDVYAQRGYTLIGWSDEQGNDFPTSGYYNLTQGTTLTAKWSLNEYAINYDLDGGENAEGNPSFYSVESDAINLLSPTKEGYRFDGWSDGKGIVSSIPSGSVGNVNLTATWSQYHSLTVASSDETKGAAELLTSGEKFCSGDVVSVKAAAKSGFKFESWNIDDAVVSEDAEYTFTMLDKDLTLIAKWESSKDFVVSSENEALGTVSVTSGSGSNFTGDRIQVTATPASGCGFKGWYNEGGLISSSNPYSFEMPSTNYSLVAKFYTAEEMNKIALGIIPSIDVDARTITYGLYPQNHVSDETTIASLNALTTTESNGWYLLDGEYYAKTAIDHFYYDSDGYFDDGTKIINGSSAWFKCEPIRWKVLSSSDFGYSLVSTVVLDAHRYNDSYSGTRNGIYASNYANSEI